MQDTKFSRQDFRLASVAGDVDTVTVGAAFWGRLIEHHGLAFDVKHRHMAECAPHILVPAFEREVGALLVVERGRAPLHCVVATLTFGDLAAVGELIAVNFRVTVIALAGSSLEVDIA
jgi:hypothetical protein